MSSSEVENQTAPVRVMIVDDSALMRKLLTETLRRDPGIEVIDTAMDGQFALDHLRKVRPDVILMDVDMPRLDGLSALERIVADYSLPVVMCSSQTTAGAQATIQALARGAVDFIEKPTLAALTSGAATIEIGAKIRGAKNAKVKKVRSLPVDKPTSVQPAPNEQVAFKSTKQIEKLAREIKPELIAIGTSTGGPPALEQVLTALPATFPLGIVIVQHMPPGFTQQLADHLDRITPLKVREAVDRQPVEPGTALIAPGGAHLRVNRGASGYFVTVDYRSPAVSSHRPSVDVLFESVAASAGRRSAAVLMTGMGSDGAQGLGKLAEVGALTIAQTTDSCVCYGMPKSAIDRGYARAIIPLDHIAPVLVACGSVSSETT